jgi:hypothetical protein
MYHSNQNLLFVYTLLQPTLLCVFQQNHQL